MLQKLNSLEKWLFYTHVALRLAHVIVSSVRNVDTSDLDRDPQGALKLA